MKNRDFVIPGERFSNTPAATHEILSTESMLTSVVGDNAPVHVELATSRREAVPPSGRRRLRAARGGRKQMPDHAGGVERVQVVESPCRHRWIKD
jgi:hypothetical protein